MSNYLMPGEVRCWSCGKWMSNNELENADGCCPFCDEEICTNEPPYTSDSEQGGPMNDITALSLIAKIKKQTESYDTVVLREDEAKALVEALEMKEEQRANWFHMAQKIGDELDAAEKRIASLESSTVTVKLPEPFKMAKASSGLTYYYADEIDKALAAAGINVEVE